MGYRVKLLPSGHEFLAEPQETLLEAALRSGVNINYNCSTGSCGGCKVRVLAGSCEDRTFHDFRLTESERNRGVVLLCTNHAASDLLIEAQEAHDATDIPHQQLTAKVAKIERLNDSILSLLLRTPRSQTLRFLAGQHAELQLAGQTIDLPIASCPCNGMMVQFHLRVGRDEPLASHLLTQGRVGDSVAVAGPFGEFVLDDYSTRPMVMIAEDTGFGAIKALIEHAVNLEKPQPLRLYRLATDADGLYMGNYCEAWRDALDDFSYTSMLLARHDELPDALARIIRAIAEPQQCDLYMAVSPPLAAEAHRLLLEVGVPAERIFFHQRRSLARAPSMAHPRKIVSLP